MPEDIAILPSLHSSLKEEPNLQRAIVQGSEHFAQTKDTRTEPYLDIIRKAIGPIRKVIEKRFPNYPEEKIELLFDLIFGFTRLQKETLTSLGGIENQYEKDTSARIQHTYVHQIVAASSKGVSESFIEAIYTVVKNTDHFALVFSNREQNNLKILWEGVRNQLAVVRALLDAGYAVYLPDYTQNTSLIEDDENEVLQLDVKRGVDIIAVSKDGVVFLIDAKGRAMVGQGEHQQHLHQVMVTDTQNVELGLNTHPVLRGAIHSVCPNFKRVFKATVIIPTEGRSFKPVNFRTTPKDTEQKRYLLQNFGNLQYDLKQSIIAELESLKTKYRLFPWTKLRPI